LLFVFVLLFAFDADYDADLRPVVFDFAFAVVFAFALDFVFDFDFDFDFEADVRSAPDRVVLTVVVRQGLPDRVGGRGRRGRSRSRRQDLLAGSVRSLLLNRVHLLLYLCHA
jgi:hypothetical protein